VGPLAETSLPAAPAHRDQVGIGPWGPAWTLFSIDRKEAQLIKATGI
jgi:hypothetical protein